LQGDDDLLLAAFERGLRRSQLDGRERSGLDHLLVVLKLGAGQLHRVARDLLVADGEDQVPVGPLHGADDLDHALSELAVGAV
jgi:hypothetical protein